MCKECENIEDRSIFDKKIGDIQLRFVIRGDKKILQYRKYFRNTYTTSYTCWKDVPLVVDEED